ncbi:hypothetical protein [Rhizobium alvei]|uniref:Uncharacterized protein n=1 Tax=Rhizobium alvei TaxID=1132659 RepID=A0ABT8YTD4_9HYPH|nr:hypothetical protein [Rhizobium alvei]MDO6967033.1 hypothetical protein [Rhizobium alvei]
MAVSPKSSDTSTGEQNKAVVEALAKLAAQNEIVANVQAQIGHMNASMAAFMSRLGQLMAVVSIGVGLVGVWQLSQQNQRITDAVAQSERNEREREERFKKLTEFWSVSEIIITNQRNLTDYIYAVPELVMTPLGENAKVWSAKISFNVKLEFRGSTTAKLNSLNIILNREFVDNFYLGNEQTRRMEEAEKTFDLGSITMVSGAPKSPVINLRVLVGSCEAAKAHLEKLSRLDFFGDIRISPVFEVANQPPTAQMFKVKLVMDPSILNCDMLTGKVSPTISMPSNSSDQSPN